MDGLLDPGAGLASARIASVKPATQERRGRHSHGDRGNEFVCSSDLSYGQCVAVLRGNESPFIYGAARRRAALTGHVVDRAAASPPFPRTGLERSVSEIGRGEDARDDPWSEARAEPGRLVRFRSKSQKPQGLRLFDLAPSPVRNRAEIGT